MQYEYNCADSTWEENENSSMLGFLGLTIKGFREQFTGSQAWRR